MGSGRELSRPAAGVPARCGRLARPARPSAWAHAGGTCAQVPGRPGGAGGAAGPALPAGLAPGDERRVTQGDRGGPRAAWHGRCPPGACSESLSAPGDAPRRWPPAAWHLLTHIFTQLLFLRTETKKEKKEKNTQCRARCLAPLHGRSGGRGGGVVPSSPTGTEAPTDAIRGPGCSCPQPPRPPAPSLGTGCVSSVFATKGRGKLASHEITPITPSEGGNRANDQRGPLDLFLWAEKTKTEIHPKSSARK